MEDVPLGVKAEHPVEVEACEFIEDAYEAIMEATATGKITILRYEDINEKMREFIAKSVREEYAAATEHPEYRYFLRRKFEISLDVFLGI